MRYLFDTDTLSALTKRAPPVPLLQRLAVTPRDEPATSSVTVAEMLYGAHRDRQRAAELLARIERAAARLPVLAFDAQAAEVYGRLRADLERRGIPIGNADTQIASIALANRLVVVTGNLRHFERVPALQVENWLI